MEVTSNEIQSTTPSYTKIETDDREAIARIWSALLDNGAPHRVNIQKLQNGNYELETIKQQAEPPIS